MCKIYSHYYFISIATVVSGDIVDQQGLFIVDNLLKKSKTEKWGDKSYWLAPYLMDEAEFILSLGEKLRVDGVELVNTRNGEARDRSMKDFMIFVGDNADGPWYHILNETLPDGRMEEDPMPIHSFGTLGLKGSYVKFQQLSYYGLGGGLNYFAAYSGVKSLQNT